MKKHASDDGTPSVMPPNAVRLDRDSTLTAERIQALEKIGFCWDVRMSGWFARFNDLKTYVSAHGHANVPSVFRGNQKVRKRTSFFMFLAAFPVLVQNIVVSVQLPLTSFLFKLAVWVKSQRHQCELQCFLQAVPLFCPIASCPAFHKID